MKKFLTLLVLTFIGLGSLFADDSILQKYFYYTCNILNRNYSVQNSFPSISGKPLGLYEFLEIEGKKCIMATVGDESAYEILVQKVVEGYENKGIRIDTYVGEMYFQGKWADINVFLEYDLIKNRVVPETITFDVKNSPNYIQFREITLVE